MTLLRSIIALLAGILLAAVCFIAIDYAGMRLYPLRAGMRLGETPMSDVIASRPFGAVLFNFILRLPAVFAGALVAARIAPVRPMWHGAIVAFVWVAFVVAGALQAPFPRWATLAAVVLMPLSGYFGARAASSRLD